MTWLVDLSLPLPLATHILSKWAHEQNSHSGRQWPYHGGMLPSKAVKLFPSWRWQHLSQRRPHSGSQLLHSALRRLHHHEGTSHLLCQGLPGAISKMAPIERVKLLLQVQRASKQIAAKQQHRAQRTAWCASPRSRACCPAGQAAWPTSLLLPWDASPQLHLQG